MCSSEKPHGAKSATPSLATPIAPWSHRLANERGEAVRQDNIFEHPRVTTGGLGDQCGGVCPQAIGPGPVLLGVATRRLGRPELLGDLEDVAIIVVQLDTRQGAGDALAAGNADAGETVGQGGGHRGRVGCTA